MDGEKKHTAGCKSYRIKHQKCQYLKENTLIYCINIVYSVEKNITCVVLETSHSVKINFLYLELND